MWRGGYADLRHVLGVWRVTSTVYLDAVPTLYVLAFTVTLLLGARLADRVGRKRTLLIGLVGFAVAAVVVATASTSEWFTAGRMVQGVFAALVSSSAPVLVSTSFTDREERRKAFGIHLAIACSGPTLGLLAGWPLLETLAWRWSVLAVTPLVLVAVLGTATQVHDRPGRLGARVDVPGVLLGFGAIAAAGGAVPHFTSQEVVLPLATGILVTAFVWWQTKTAGALAPLPGDDVRASVGYVLATALGGVSAGFLLAAMGHGYY
ncbi:MULTISPECIES: MFS transporter [Streptomyces]|uniref:MFS transporter n=1 Tax=Streptomyces TaxID=1883 RepID=UPI00068F2D71|nr:MULTISPECIES: MFS transporter [Streptomyces]